MRSTRWFAATLALAGLGLAATTACRAQDDPFNQLKSYDGQDRAAVMKINQMVSDALGDKAKLAAIEDRLLPVVQDGSATFLARQEAGRFLWAVGSAKSVPVLVKLLGDEKLANVARYGLERNADPAAGAALRGALKGAKGPILVGIINTLGDRRDPAAVGSVKPYVKSTEPLVSEAAVTSLGKIGTPDAVAVLKALPASPVADAAMIRAGERLTAAGNRALAESVFLAEAKSGHSASAQAAAIKGLATVNSTAFASTALAAIKSGTPNVQRVAVRALGLEARPAVTSALVAAYPSLSTSLQAVALGAFADSKTTAAVPLLTGAVNSTDNELKLAAISAAQRLGAAPTVPTLAAISAGNGPGHEEARNALAAMPGAAAEQAILAAARSGAPETRAAMMAVLAQRGTPAGVSLLVEAAHGADTTVAVAALRGLGQVANAQQQGEIVKVLLASQDDGVRDAARNAVVSSAQRLSNRDDVLTPILAALPSAPAASQGALYSAVADLGGDKALAALTQALSSSNNDVKRAAISAIGDRWGDARPADALFAVAKGDSDSGTRVRAVRSYLNLLDNAGGIPADQKAARIGEALGVAERPEEKKMALNLLRDCRTNAAVVLAAKYLDDEDLSEDAADTVIDLAGAQNRDNRRLSAVKSAETTAALDKIIASTKDEDVRKKAQKAKG